MHTHARARYTDCSTVKKRWRKRRDEEARGEDAETARHRADDGKRVRFPNELRLHGPEECVGILIKHQSYTTGMIEIVSSTAAPRAERGPFLSSLAVLPLDSYARLWSRSCSRPSPLFLIDPSIVSHGQQITFRRCVVRPLIFFARTPLFLVSSRFESPCPISVPL